MEQQEEHRGCGDDELRALVQALQKHVRRRHLVSSLAALRSSSNNTTTKRRRRRGHRAPVSASSLWIKRFLLSGKTTDDDDGVEEEEEEESSKTLVANKKAKTKTRGCRGSGAPCGVGCTPTRSNSMKKIFVKGEMSCFFPLSGERK